MYPLFHHTQRSVLYANGSQTCDKLRYLISSPFFGSTDSKKQVIDVSLPGESDVQYLDNLQFIADFVIEMDGKTKGRDYLFIIHDESGVKYLKNHKFTNARLIQAKQSLDMWMRDFPPHHAKTAG